jgi:hypothetical protein
MKITPALCTLLSVCCLNLLAGERGELIFEDHFERSEPQEQTDQPGNGWNTNSKSRAKNNKQVDLRDGAMYIAISPEADHAVSVSHPAEFTDGSVSLRFRLDDAKDSLGLDFADPKCKTVHAGHLFAVRINPKQIALQDLKTGNMNLAVYEARKTKKITEEQTRALQEKQKTIPFPLATGTWHELLVTIDGPALSVEINGRPAGHFSSDGIAHPAKRLLRLAVPRAAVVDDIALFRKK